MSSHRYNFTDVFLIAVLILLTNLFIFIPDLAVTPIRTVLGLFLLLFVPGYTLVSALFPRKDDLEGLERVALSLGLSIAIVPLVGLALNFTAFGIRQEPVLIAISVFSILMCFITLYRRHRLSADEAFYFSFSNTYKSLKPEFSNDQSKTNKLISIILLVCIIISIVALVNAYIAPNKGEKFTEFYILGVDGKANNYTTRLTLGQPNNVMVGVANHEGSRTNYTIDIRLNGISVISPTSIKSFSLNDSATWQSNVTYIPNVLNNTQKLEVLLFKDQNFNTSYRDLHLWVDVRST